MMIIKNIIFFIPEAVSHSYSKPGFFFRSLPACSDITPTSGSQAAQQNPKAVTLGADSRAALMLQCLPLRCYDKC